MSKNRIGEFGKIFTQFEKQGGVSLGLIGEKVVYKEKYLRFCEKRGCKIDKQIPARGYFTITKAILRKDGKVMVALDGY
jgi:hypothetical protein